MIDYSFDPCRNLSQLDLNARDDQVKILKRDKHARIEGLYTEKLFVKDLLSTSFPVFSTGWWFVSSTGTYKVFKLVDDVNNM